MAKNILLAACAVAAVLPLVHGDGCGTKHNTGYNDGASTHTIESGGLNRTYAVWIPPTYNNDLSKRWPVIFDYHGNGGTSYEQYENSMYYNYTPGQNYVVVYPQGYEGHWQGPSYAVKGVNDLQFTSDLLARIESAYCIDATRVYASGKSNGGGFVDTLACSDSGDDFTAFAMASAALYTDNSESSCTKKRAILESHGDLDTTIPYHPTANASGGQVPDITKWVSWWGERTCGDGAQAQYSGDLGGYNTTTYSCGSYTNVISHYQVFQLGHCWPSSNSENYDATRSGAASAHCLDEALDFTPVVLDFFGRWTSANIPDQ